MVAADELAQRLHEAHAEAEPLEIDAATLSEWVRDVGGDPDDDVLVAQTVIAWSHLIP